MKIHRNTSKKAPIIIASVIGLILLLGLLEWAGVIDIIKSTPKIITTDTETTSEQESAQTDFTGQKDKDATRLDKEEGIVTDNKGAISDTPPANQWSVSESGLIKVYSPARNSLLGRGDILAGEARSETVSFRLIDDVSGVIANGTLAVTGGKFSGTFDFVSSGQSGRVDVFNADDKGLESNIVEIPVRFK